MTDIEQKALALVNEVQRERQARNWLELRRREMSSCEALCRAIEQHEAFRREVSDEIAKLGCWPDTVNLQRFILPKPVHPLVQAAADIDLFWNADMGAKLEAALAARGMKIVDVE